MDDGVETVAAPASAAGAAEATASTAARLVHVDNLRTGLIAWIIGGHALIGYSAVGGWEYAEVTETTFGPHLEIVLAAILAPSALLVIGTFFFLAGLFVPRSMAKHGVRRFVVDRTVRLGVPYLAFALLLWPLLIWLTYRVCGRPVSFRWVVTERKPLLDAGPLWFVAVLLIFLLGYAALVKLGVARPTIESAGGQIRGVHLVVLAVGVALVTFVVRLWLPARGQQPGDLHGWEWPQCLALFGLGIASANRGLGIRVPDRMRRACGFTVLLTICALPLLAAVTGLYELARDLGPFLGGWRWQSLLATSIEGVLVVAGSVWLLGTAQRRFVGTGRLATATARSAYAAFVVQGPVLLALAVALRPVALPVEIKALLVAAGGIVGSFWLAWLLVTRTVLRRVL